MKQLKLFGLLVLCACTAQLQAQEQIRIWQADSDTRLTASDITFSEDGTAFSVADQTFETAKVDSFKVVHTVYVTFSDATATVDLGHAPDVTASVDGAHVAIVSTNAKHELEFVLQGSSTQGSLTYTGPVKCRFYLNGLNLTSNRGAALDIQCGKRVAMTLVDGTANYLTDAAGGEQKAALYCKGHLEVSGSGSLTVKGNTKHAIATKEYLQLKAGTGAITVTGAVADGVHVGQYFLMSGGTLNISGQGADGLQVEVKTLDDDVTPDNTKEHNGMMFIQGGKITIVASADDSKAIKVPVDLTISGGVFKITASGDGSRGIAVTGNMLVNQNNNPTAITVTASGDIYTDPVTDEDSKCWGIRVKGNFTVTAGTIVLTRKGQAKYGKIDGTFSVTNATLVPSGWNGTNG